MVKRFQIAPAVLVAALACASAMAQTRGGASPMHMTSLHLASSARTSTGAPRAVRQSRVIQFSPSGQVASGFASFPNSANFGAANGVPGLGFDYPHLAAIGGGLRNGRTSNFGRGNHRRQSTFVPIFFGGYPYYGYGDWNGEPSDYEQPQQQPQVIVIQQPVPVTQQAVDSGNDSTTPSTDSSQATASSPVRDVGEFVLVRRDGRILFASAFSVAGTQLHYITPEGIRRTLPLADLDTDATQQMNEARGTTVQIQN